MTVSAATRVESRVSPAPTVEGVTDAGRPIKAVAGRPYYEPLSVAIDKSWTLDPQSLVDKVSEIIEEMHKDGTLSKLSEKWYGSDLTQPPA